MHSPSVDVRGYDMIPISEHSADSWAPEDSQRTFEQRHRGEPCKAKPQGPPAARCWGWGAIL